MSSILHGNPGGPVDPPQVCPGCFIRQGPHRKQGPLKQDGPSRAYLQNRGRGGGRPRGLVCDPGRWQQQGCVHLQAWRNRERAEPTKTESWREATYVGQ